jgi:hypothetical protein
MQRLARPAAPLLHTDTRLLALNFASALLTDYGGWSAWRQLGAWDSRHDC